MKGQTTGNRFGLALPICCLPLRCGGRVLDNAQAEKVTTTKVSSAVEVVFGSKIRSALVKRSSPALVVRADEGRSLGDTNQLPHLCRSRYRKSSLPAVSRSSSIEELASKANIHPKVMREALKLAFLAPDIVTSIFGGEAAFELADLRKISALSWQSQRKELHRERSPQHSN